LKFARFHDTNGVMLKKCLHCGKDAPAQLAVCPYCHQNEEGENVTLTSEKSAVLNEGQVQSDLAQLGHEDPLIQKEAADRLSQRGPAIVPLLVNRLSENVHKGASQTARLLGRFRDRRGLSALIQVLKTGDEEAKVSAVWSLSQLNDAGALDELLRECDRNNPTVQGYLAHVIVGYQDPRVLPSLLKLAAHSNREVAFQAAWALGEAGNPQPIDPLRRLLSRRDPDLKTVAQHALRRLGGPVRHVVSFWGYAWVLAVIVAGLGLWFVMAYYK
jgi:HEAT repeat protein